MFDVVISGLLIWCFVQNKQWSYGSYVCRYDAIRVGEPAEVLVLSKLRTFETFKVRHKCTL